MAAIHSLWISRSGRSDQPSPTWRRSIPATLRFLLGGLLLTLGASCLGATTYFYDSLAHLRIVTYGDGTQIQYGYDAAGNVISRTVGTVAGPNGTLNVDASTAAAKYDALTDGLLVVRYMTGVTGPALTAGVLGATATRIDPTAIKNYLDGLGLALDIDGNNQVSALTDGLLIVRYLFGLRGDALVAGAVDPLGSRHTGPDVETYLQSLMP